MYKNYTSNNPWTKVIDEAVDKFEFPNTKNTNDNIIKYYANTNNYLMSNCAAFDSTDECDPVKEHYDKCKGITADCTNWPVQIMLPEYCCNVPEILPSQVKAECYKQCESKPGQSNRAVCYRDCIVKKLSVRDGDKIDFEAVKKLLIGNANKSASWDKAVDKAVKSCETIVKGNFFKGLNKEMTEVL